MSGVCFYGRKWITVTFGDSALYDAKINVGCLLLPNASSQRAPCSVRSSVFCCTHISIANLARRSVLSQKFWVSYMHTCINSPLTAWRKVFLGAEVAILSGKPLNYVITLATISKMATRSGKRLGGKKLHFSNWKCPNMKLSYLLREFRLDIHSIYIKIIL